VRAAGVRERLGLPAARVEGPLSVEAALLARRSVRSFARGALALEQVAQLLWSAQGVTAGSRRTAPSAGALYPLEVALVAGEVEDLSAGVYRYLPEGHALRPVLDGDLRAALAEAALGQSWIAGAACGLVLAAVYRRSTRKYGARGRRYVHMEVGLAAQNVYLQARALGLGTTMVGAFQDEKVQRLLGFEADEVPLGILPIGRLR
jgi:SagB-type dehydrogenase family enzyme